MAEYLILVTHAIFLASKIDAKVVFFKSKLLHKGPTALHIWIIITINLATLTPRERKGKVPKARVDHWLFTNIE